MNYAKHEGASPAILPQSREGLRMNEKAPPPFAPTASLKAATGAFEEHMEREGFSPNTIKAFRSDLNILIQFAGAGRAVGEIGTKDLNDYLEWFEAFF